MPVDVVKQNAQVKQINMSSYQVFKEIARLEGFRGFFRAYLTTVLREIPFGTIQFPLWEYFKQSIVEYKEHKGVCEPHESAVCGALAGNFRLLFS